LPAVSGGGRLTKIGDDDLRGLSDDLRRLIDKLR
jgi:hypothetical protein